MAKADALTVAEVLAKADLIDRALAAWEETAPHTVASLGGRDALARRSEMTCIGPVPRLDAATWERASREHEERRLYAAGNSYAAPPGMYEPGPAADAHADTPLPPPAPAPRRSRWRIWG
jgi:hypothetical protein